MEQVHRFPVLNQYEIIAIINQIIKQKKVVYALICRVKLLDTKRNKMAETAF
jgi:hypothetical protein